MGGFLGSGARAERPARAIRCVFLSGNHAPGEFRDGNSGSLRELRANRILLISSTLSMPPLLATVVQYKCRREVAMIRRAFFLHYRMVREVITIAITLGMAALLGYLILQVRL
jgi:hypothetical protein